MTLKPRVIFALLAVPLLCPSFGYAADAKAASLIGTVNVQKVISDYNGAKTANDDIQALATKLENQFNYRSANKLLTEAELTQLETLKAKPTPTDADKKSVTDLEAKAKNLADELAKLQQATSPTPEEKARLKELSDLSADADKRLETLADGYKKQVDGKKSELGDKVTETIKAAIKQVGADKNMTAIFDEVAVLYGGVDVTQAVLDKLNKK